MSSPFCFSETLSIEQYRCFSPGISKGFTGATKAVVSIPSSVANAFQDTGGCLKRSSACGIQMSGSEESDTDFYSHIHNAWCKCLQGEEGVQINESLLEWSNRPSSKHILRLASLPMVMHACLFACPVRWHVDSHKVQGDSRASRFVTIPYEKAKTYSHTHARTHTNRKSQTRVFAHKHKCLLHTHANYTRLFAGPKEEETLPTASFEQVDPEPYELYDSQVCVYRWVCVFTLRV